MSSIVFKLIFFLTTYFCIFFYDCVFLKLLVKILKTFIKKYECFLFLKHFPKS